jgi:hypothetical protein
MVLTNTLVSIKVDVTPPLTPDTKELLSLRSYGA